MKDKEQVLIPIRYVGSKPVHEDVLYGTGLVWRPGHVHHVTPEVASWLLQHPDVYEDARSDSAKKKSPIKPSPPPTPRTDHVNEVPLANLTYMTKEQMARYNERYFGERLDASKMTAAQMRTHIISRMREVA